MRNHSRTLIAIGTAALLVGCTGSAGPCNPTAAPAFPPPADDQCGAGPLLRYAGAELTPAIRDEITAGRSGSAVRFIAPGDAVTQDFRADRLNVTLDEQNRIARLYCG